MTEFPSVDTRELRKRLGVDIDAETFLLSLTHRSYAFENPGVEHNGAPGVSLGDSVLSLAIAEEVYRRYPDLPEGELVKLHHVVVSTVALAKVARDLDLAGTSCSVRARFTPAAPIRTRSLPTPWKRFSG